MEGSENTFVTIPHLLIQWPVANTCYRQRSMQMGRTIDQCARHIYSSARVVGPNSYSASTMAGNSSISSYTYAHFRIWQEPSPTSRLFHGFKTCGAAAVALHALLALANTSADAVESRFCLACLGGGRAMEGCDTRAPACGRVCHCTTHRKTRFKRGPTTSGERA